LKKGLGYGVIFNLTLREPMKKTLILCVMLLIPFINLIADEGCYIHLIPNQIEDLKISQNTKKEYEHRINFGFLNLGYERVKTDSIYTGLDVKMTSVLYSDAKKKDPLDYFVNAELRMGYNHAFSESDQIIPYLATGFSVFSLQNKVDKVKNWTYASTGIKYFHQFGPIFEMGLHIKGYISINQKRKVLKEVEVIVSQDTPVYDSKPTATFTKTESKLVSIKDTRWMSEIAIPFIWHVGDEKNWEIQFEPYFSQIPNAKITNLIGSRLTCAYRF
jgi:hypothetical protein